LSKEERAELRMPLSGSQPEYAQWAG